MNLSAEQFVQTENYFLSAIAENAGHYLTLNNYGLLPSKNKNKLYNGIRVNEHVTGYIEVQLYNCRAITSSGYIIDFDSEEVGLPLIKQYTPSEDKSIGKRDIRHWDVILSVDPFNRLPTGEPDPEEVPPRHPDCESSYALYIMPVGDINTMEFGKHHLIIGRLLKDGDSYFVDTDYIPPATCMSAHPELLDYYNAFCSHFISIEKSSKIIIGKINTHPNRSDLPANIQAMCKDVLQYIAQIYFDLRNTALSASPTLTVSCISGLAHTCFISLLLLDNKQKEEMLKYFYEWTDIAPGAFEDLIASTLEIIYVHNDLRSIMKHCKQFLSKFTELWERMSRLEYIGQRKESIVVSESKEKDITTTTRRWIVTE